MTATNAILETQDLSFGFGGNLVTDHVSLQVRDGEFLSIIGPNGAGKTTLFNLLSGLYRPSGGRILYRGRDITSKGPAFRARSGLARSFQISSGFPHLSNWENVRLAAQARGGHGYQIFRPSSTYQGYGEAAERALHVVGLVDRRGATAISLSHGDKRKLELAMVIAADPDILLLDEPTSGVSAEDVSAMVDLIARIREVERKTIIMVEHKMGVVIRLSDRIAVLQSGRLLAVDTPENIQRNEAVQMAYLGKENA